ncbi:MAG TPA: response regulator, partial [Candidatus Atribacteria bacterium]|nr:response regulator [Candidatus Atribacteria bacterium]
VIDDEEIVREMMKDVLEELGYTPLFAKNGKEGVELFKKIYNDIDLVMIDMNMPELAGRETFRKIKEIAPSVKTILISGFGLNGTVSKLLEEGFSAFLHKPFTLGELSEVLNEVLQ